MNRETAEIQAKQFLETIFGAGDERFRPLQDTLVQLLVNGEQKETEPLPPPVVVEVPAPPPVVVEAPKPAPPPPPPPKPAPKPVPKPVHKPLLKKK